MKISFSTKVETNFMFQGKSCTSSEISTAFAINTEKIVAWSLVEGELHLWFEGISESVCLTQDSPRLGNSKDNFNALLLCLRSEFKDFDATVPSTENYGGEAIMDSYIDPEEFNTDCYTDC